MEKFTTDLHRPTSTSVNPESTYPTNLRRQQGRPPKVETRDDAFSAAQQGEIIHPSDERPGAASQGLNKPPVTNGISWPNQLAFGTRKKDMSEKVAMYLIYLREYQPTKEFGKSYGMLDAVIVTAEKHNIALTDIFYGDFKENNLSDSRNVLVYSILSGDEAVSALIASKYPPNSKRQDHLFAAYRAAIMTENSSCMFALEKHLDQMFKYTKRPDSEYLLRDLLMESKNADFILNHSKNAFEAVQTAVYKRDAQLATDLIISASKQICGDSSNETREASNTLDFARKFPVSKVQTISGPE